MAGALSFLGMTEGEIQRSIDAIWRIESPKVIAVLTRKTGDVTMAEDLAQDALLAALEQWPAAGVPSNPGGWLVRVALRKGIDQWRRAGRFAEREGEITRDLEGRQEANATQVDDRLDDPIGDDLLGLIFMTCHPILSTEARVALTLRLLGGLATPEIARAFLVPEPTIAQRIVRAKRTLAEAKVPFEVPRGTELHERLPSVLEVVYLIFNEGYSATAGEDLIRPTLCEEALRLGRILAGLAPQEAEVHGLVALMELQASRLRARVGPGGTPVLLMDQDRSRWDAILVRRGLAALAQATSLGGPLGPYTLQAAIAACHAQARTPAETDWARIAALYDALAQVAPSPVVELNQAVAIGMAFGPEAGLRAVDALLEEKSLQAYHLLPAVRGDLLAKLGRHDEARAEFTRAASLTENQRERALLLGRAKTGT
ncbi:MAG TPA: RNA polymerase sigma factor [Gemmatimonadales bacterium]|nr:RNA polymerase sigma factor [Gemmatimonadales bacterium]